ncbi:MAG TPA: ester cyclase [Anaerolineales bacterium]|nr:ester cyclase [Anaerolineales bacterium]
MNKRETVQALMDAVQKGDLEYAKSMLADDFQFSGPIPEPINKDAWLEMSASLKTAFSDIDYHFKVIGAEGDIVRSTSQLSGTHNGVFDLTNMNMGVISATNKTFSTKSEKTKITVKDDKITLWVVEPNDGAGLMEILKQLDVKLPTL